MSPGNGNKMGEHFFSAEKTIDNNHVSVKQHMGPEWLRHHRCVVEDTQADATFLHAHNEVHCCVSDLRTNECEAKCEKR